ncbi:MAG: YjdF family protein [Oscillospiraceae bacterium]|nr:YjdF family protein [Oscillospiraceae bacterium]
MDAVKIKLTVFFDPPFWVGVFERIEKGKLSVCKVTFGAEPRDCEVWDFVLKNYDKLKFSPAVDVKIKTDAENPKRRQREAKKQMQPKHLGTKAQQALQLQREQNKTERRSVSKQQREEEKQRRFEQRQQKRKEKHRGK